MNDIADIRMSIVLHKPNEYIYKGTNRNANKQKFLSFTKKKTLSNSEYKFSHSKLHIKIDKIKILQSN